MPSLPPPPDPVAAARALLGVPFRLHGRNARGLDCLGLAWLAARRCGVCLPDVHDYDQLPPVATVVPRLSAVLPAAGPTVDAGQLAVFAVAGRHAHLGIVSSLACGRFGVIHAYAPLGRVVEHGLDTRWRRRLICRFEITVKEGS